MAHELQERYSQLVDIKLRNTLVTKDGVIFNTRYEGSPKAGAVKIPVRDTETTVVKYNKRTGARKSQGATSYITLTIDKDYAVNEIIDGYDARAVPDNLVADRLDSASYSLASQLDKDGIAVLEDKATATGTTTALTKATVYDAFVDARTALSKANVPADRRFALVSPETMALLLTSSEFVRATSLGDAVVQTGAVGRIAGFNIYEANTLGEKTEFIVGHPDWCVRVKEWQVPVKIQDLSGSGDYIGASAVQGRMVYAHTVTKANTLLAKQKV